MMVGEKVTLDIERPEPVNPKKRLIVKDVTCVNKEGFTTLDHASFEANSGEILGIAGIAGISLGLLLGLIVPINKPLWSSSYVLFAGGISAMLFALFYWIIDVLGYRKWAFYFKVIGLNSITIYMLQKIVDLKKVTRFFFGGLAGLVPDVWGGFILAVGYLSVCFVILYFLYRKKIFLKV